ncbi:hypothetical protein COCNU_03G005220 [Cocos nucifera]|uniref:Uncharacterized protein n=1 Tax=Cocos nucifera TaxID=13894 RepID=A0A8K0I2B7_COCNU|nr:hypothetical protein COCNU_03G005220 [Cocos nucifera]
MNLRTSHGSLLLILKNIISRVVIRNQTLFAVEKLNEEVDALLGCAWLLCSMEALGMAFLV